MVVVAKLCEPTVRDVLARPRVSKLLDAAAKHRLIWVSGPAGAGKTTAVCSWLAARRRPRTWYRVDAGDSDASSLFHYLATTTSQRLPTMSLEVSVAQFARRYFEALSAHWNDRHVLVLDDHHEARGQLDDVLRVATEAMQPKAVIVVISREPPSGAFSRAFASRDAVHVDWETLRLTPSEARGAARLIAKKHVPSTKVVDELQRLTDGWPAGLAMLLAHPELAAIAEREHEHLVARLGESGGAQRVFDYIASEMFDHEPAATRDFLLRTAPMPAFTEAWASELTGVPNARAILHRLEAGPFAKRHTGGVYRYHPLFRAFLLDRAATLDDLDELRRRSGALLVAANQLDWGFELLSRARDWPACTRVILHAAPQLVAQGRRATLLGWLSALPDAVVGASAWLTFWKAACMLGAEPLASARLLDHAIAKFDGDSAGTHAAWSARVQACVHAGMDLSPIDGWLAELDDAAPVGVGHLLALFRCPGHPRAHIWVAEALDRWRGLPDPSARAMTAALLIPICCFSGDLGRAATVLDGLRGERVEVEPLAAVTLANGEAVFAWATADNVACRAAVDRGLATAAASGIVVWNDQLAALGCSAALATGELDAAQRYLDRMRETSGGSNFATGNSEYYAGWLALLRGELPRALASIETAVRLSDAYGYPLAQVLSRVALSLVLARLARDPKPVLAEASSLAAASRSQFLSFACALAIACIDQTDAEIARAFALGRALGVYNMFFWIRDRIATCCERARVAAIEPAYVAELVRRHRLSQPVRIHVLGGLAIEGVVFGKKPPQVPLRLLSVLVALGGRDVPEARLVDAVWPDADGAQARASLHTTLHRLRKLLGHDGALRHHNGRVALDPEIVWLDAWYAERACAAVEAALARGKLGELGASVDELLAAYRGPLLGADDTAACIIAARAKLHGRIGRSVRAAGRELPDL
ncbi:MAG TPA: hypothetical protein VGG74_28900 [Kofleriaceae bacterium]|jgi:hypothetical protein